MRKRTILIDLDGILNTYTGGYQEDYIPPISSGAKEFLEGLASDFDLKLFTTRPVKLAEKWLENNEILSLFSEVTNVKKTSWLMIDDRCLTFEGDFEKLALQVADFKPWYKKGGF